MSQIEEAKGGWPPHDPIAHLATHAPIQAQPETSQSSFHATQPNSWVSPFASLIAAGPQFLAGKWAGHVDWSANNNKWENGQGFDNLPKFDQTSLTTIMPTTSPETAQVKTEPTHPNDVTDVMKEEERKPTEHTISINTSISQSSNRAEEDSNSSDEPIDVECMNQEKPQDMDCSYEYVDEPMDETSSTKTSIKKELDMEEPEKMDVRECNEDTSTSNGTTNSIAEKSLESILKPKPIFGGFLHSGTSAFSNIEPNSSVNREIPRPASPANNTEAAAPAPVQSSTSFCRPPGLGPVTIPPETDGGVKTFVCALCGFSCASKFHYNSHMNTHGDHQCDMCDYTSRTEGRLKKHMRESHTLEQRIKAGFEVGKEAEASAAAAQPSSTEIVPPVSEPSSSNFIINLSTTMASILDSTASAIAATMASSDSPSSIPTSLNLDLANTPNLLNSLAQNPLASSALDQIRAFTENSNLLPDGGLSLASALGVVSQAISNEPKTPEKTSNGETRRSSSGKVKILKCKQCGHQSTSKDDQWLHARTHIPAEKQLNCQHCNFVTEYKHHLEYHYRNHMGSKPFHCKKCSYTCVNKSMLNSHMKSHTNHYQFRCIDCTYATKYCHSLKLHLKKYKHRRHLDGNESPEAAEQSPNQLAVPIGPVPAFPNLVLDKKFDAKPILPQTFNFNTIANNDTLNYASQLIANQHPNPMEALNPLLTLQSLRNSLTQPGDSLKCSTCDHDCATKEELFNHKMSHFMSTSVPTTLASFYNLSQLQIPLGTQPLSSAAKTEASLGIEEVADNAEHEQDRDHESEGRSVGDDMEHISHGDVSPVRSKFSSSPESCAEETQRIKSITLEQISQCLQGKSPTNSDSVEDKDDESRVGSSVSPIETQPPLKAISFDCFPNGLPPVDNNGSINSILQSVSMAYDAFQWRMKAGSNFDNTCKHCKMSFHDQVLHRIHMGYHGYDHAFKCNRCGFTANDSLNFNIHLAQAPHE